MPSPFEQRYEGFGTDMAVAVLNLFKVRRVNYAICNSIVMPRSMQVSAAVVSRATESALQKHRKAFSLTAALVKKDEGLSASVTPSPEKSELPTPTSKPKRVRPISTGNSPAVSIFAADAPSAAAKLPVAAPALPAAPEAAAASFSRPRAKKLLQGRPCFAVCAFDTTVPVPLRSPVSDYDSLLVAIHNQVGSCLSKIV
jgi:hypothetical protein